jgi:hypothetical protein
MILEIGSDQNEGSTEFFNGLSVNWEIPFYTVDVIIEPQHRFTHLDHIIWQVETGSVWTKKILPTLNKQIKVLYLDNYDWANPGPNADTIRTSYAFRNVDWSNMGSQVEHLQQMVNCMPYMADQSLVICDDTPLVAGSETYTGKCGAVVPYLLCNGYKIVYTGNNGVILARGL